MAETFFMTRQTLFWRLAPREVPTPEGSSFLSRERR